MTDGSDSAAGDPTGPTAVEDAFGRVDEAGEVFVRTPEGERHVGSWQAGEPQEALAFYERKYADLVVQVDLAEQRLASGAAAPGDAEAVLSRLREALAEPAVVGDLAGLRARLDALEQRVVASRAERRAARARALEQARVRKEAIADQAASVAEGQDWRHGAERLRALLEEWKSLPRLDKPTDDALWRRFSGARTHYTRRRKAHFAEVGARQEAAQRAKEGLVAEADALSGSTDWGQTTRAYRDLMARWKAAGPAPKPADDALWRRFRAAQDTFFAARQAAQSQRDSRHQASVAAKEALLAEAESLLPVRDWKAARETLRSLHERWEAIGDAPRQALRGLDARLRRVEDAVRTAEQSEWQRSNPEARARAAGTVAQLQASIAELDGEAAAARARGDRQAADRLEEAAAARRDWLAQARRALADFGG